MFSESGQPEISILKVDGEQGSDWVPHQMIVTVSTDWSLIIEHKTIQSLLYMGDLAVDDITITMASRSMYVLIFPIV